MQAIKNKTQKLIIISILLVLTSLVTSSEYTRNTSLEEYPSTIIENDIRNSDIVWIYNLTGGSGIYIDDTHPWSNWSYHAENYDWVTGSGTHGDPYELKNVLIDGRNQNINLITIINSDAVFRIEDCILYNTYHYDWDQTTCNAIYLENVDNGEVLNTDTSLCMNGIRLKDSELNIIHKNFASAHYESGIVISGGSKNILKNNTITYDCGINLADGTYNNDVLENNILTGDYYNDGITLSDSHYNNITSNVIFNQTESAGIYLTASNYNNVSRNVLMSCEEGLYIKFSDNNIISANVIQNSSNIWYDLDELIIEYAHNGVGLRISDSSWNTVSKNNISDSGLVGILIEDSDNHSVLENSISNSGFDDIHLINTPEIVLALNEMYSDGLYFQIRFSDLENIIIETSNQVKGKPIYFYFNVTGFNQGNFINAGQIFLYDCDDISITGNQFHNVTTGITLNQCTNSVISSNHATYNSRWGFGIFNCTKTRLIGNIATHGKKNGITFENSDINYISGNNASFNREYGISLSETHHGLIYNNNVNNNDKAGISLKGDYGHNVWNGTNWVWTSFICYNNTIKSNEMNENSETGIDAKYVDFIIITRNIVRKSTEAIYLGEFGDGVITENEVVSNIIGIKVESGSDLYVGNNTAKSNAEIEHGFIRGGVGIDIYLCSEVEVNDNELIGNAQGLTISDCSIGEIKNNYAKRNGWEEGFWIFQNRPSGDTGILIIRSYYFNITENVLNENGIGLEVCDNNSVFLNQINDFGFLFKFSDNNIISENVITNALIAIDLSGSDYNNITFNIIIAQQCFREKGCTANVFEGNDCTEVIEDLHIREILSIIGLASVLIVNVPLFLRKRKERK